MREYKCEECENWLSIEETNYGHDCQGKEEPIEMTYRPDYQEAFMEMIDGIFNNKKDRV
jgi:hypothetical protein